MQNEMNQGHDKRPLVLNREAKRTVAGLVGTSIPKLPKSVPPRVHVSFLANMWVVWCGRCTLITWTWRDGVAQWSFFEEDCVTNDRSSWDRNELRSEAPCFLVHLPALPDRQDCLVFVPEWCVSVLPNVSEAFQALFPTGFGREHDRQVAVPCCVLILQDDFPTLCDTNAYEHLRKNLRKNAGEIYLFNESITCRKKRADNFLHFDTLTSMINCYCSTI